MRHWNAPAWMMASFVAGIVFTYSCGGGGGGGSNNGNEDEDGGGGSSADGAPSDADFAALQARVATLENLLSWASSNGNPIMHEGHTCPPSSSTTLTVNGGAVTDQFVSVYGRRWFKFIATTTANHTMAVRPIEWWGDPAGTAYDSSCTQLFALHPQASRSLTGGELYYIRAYPTSQAQWTKFEVEVTQP